MELTRATKATFLKYGQDTCREAFRMWKDGNGANTIGVELGLTTRQADAAINAGRNLAEFEIERFHELERVARETKQAADFAEFLCKVV